MRIPLSFALLTLVSSVALADESDPRDASLYVRLGGTAKVTAIVEATITQASVALDQRPLVRDRWIAQICAISGGGCRASDDVTRYAPASLIDALRQAMRTQQVPLATRNELLDRLASR